MTEAGLCTIPNCRGNQTEEGDWLPARAGDGITACERHYTTYRDAVADIVDLYALLPDMLEPSSAHADGIRAKYKDPPAPLPLDVVALMDPRTERADDDTTMHVLGELERACQAVRAHRGGHQEPGQPVTAMQRYLAGQAVWCAAQPWFVDLYALVVPIVQVLRSATGMHPPKPVGRCHLCDGGRVFQLEGELTLRCSRCKQTWKTAQELARFDLVQDSYR